MSRKNGNEISTANARSKLDGVLQTLVEKKDDSPHNSDEDPGSPLIDVGVSVSVTNSPSASPRRLSRTPRKRRRRDDSALLAGQYHHTYVMKLFDRSVDLAQFEENTPLYPICRAWMRNQPLNRNLAPRPQSPVQEQPEEDEDEDADKPPNVYKMPDFIPMTKFGATDSRIPPLVQQPNEQLNIYETDVPAPENLLLNHMSRWKIVRNKWKEASKINESRYEESYKVLKEMYDRTMKDN